MVKDLRTFLSDVKTERPDEVLEIVDSVDPNLGISRLLNKFEQSQRSPIVTFRNVKGTELPVVINVHAEINRLAIALQCDVGNLVDEYTNKIASPIDPVQTSNAPVKEVKMLGDKVDLLSLPQIVTHLGDGGPYITLGCMVMRDPELGYVNLGVYRLMIKGKSKTTVLFTEPSNAYQIYRKAELLGKPLQVAVVIGHHPAFWLGAVSRVPLKEIGSDYRIVSALMGEPIRVTKGETVDLPVPADAEIVLEGEVSPSLREEEGPFGEYLGLRGAKTSSPVFDVKCVTMRKDAMFQQCFAAHTDDMNLFLLSVAANLKAIIGKSFPTLRAVNLPACGKGHLCYISLKKLSEGQAKNVILAAFGAETFLRYVIAVDEDVDIFNDSEMMKSIVLRTRVENDIFIIKRAMGDSLTPGAGEGGTVTKIGIDATRWNGYPTENVVPG